MGGLRSIYFSNYISNSGISTESLNLIVKSVNINPPEPKTNYLDVPGANGSLDLTEALGAVRYNDREAEFVCTTKPQYNRNDFEKNKINIGNLLNGKHFDYIFVDEAGANKPYYSGRITSIEFEDNFPVSEVTINATLAPYRITKVKEQYNINTSPRNITIDCGAVADIPIFNCTTVTTFIYNGKKYSCTPAADNCYSNITFGGRSNATEILYNVMGESSGKLTVIFEKRDL